MACLRQNIGAVCKSLRRGLEGLNVLQMDALAVPLGGSAVPDMVFVDPPYDIIPQITTPLFARLAERLATSPETLVVFELPGEYELEPPGWTCLKRLGKGARQPTVAVFRQLKRESEVSLA